eukprot:gene6568-13291_t
MLRKSLCALSIAIMMAPIIFKWEPNRSYSEILSSQLLTALESLSFQLTIISSTSIAFPLIFDFVFQAKFMFSCNNDVQKAKKRDINFYIERPTIETDLNSIYILADKEKMTLVMHNLISNAFKFTPVGGTIILKIQMEKKSHNDGFFIQILVIDTGCGVDEY